MYKKCFLSFLIVFSLNVVHSRSPITTQQRTTDRETAQDNESVPYLHERLVEKGDAGSLYKLAWMYDTGMSGFIQNYQTAFKWYKKAVEQGNVEAKNRVASMFERGIGVFQDLEQAIYWYKESVKKGNAWAKHRLDLIYSTPEGQRVVKKEKENLLNNQASRKENIETQFQLALAHFQGLGISQNYEMNLDWCYQPEGNTLSQNYLDTVSNVSDKTHQDNTVVFD